ncbi:hypothetical protein SAMN05660690_1491 [Geodermatophilus telluris]|uniref:Uncharacterized protein n=1 Tax=Geodermatophilus telluris TaxID=1190417 RepID=A0A1G6LPW0_9ACTN|nr:hypothetical protein [Geodermatophilus telluris]SDC45154.1 hypothetical protein SAMN05660690_1491 [Geodermatophilus telluris]
MSDRGLPVRLLSGVAALALAAVAVVGGLALRPPGLLAVGLAAVVTACLAAGVARESTDGGPAPLEAAWRTGAATIGVLLVLSGTAALGGATLTAAAAALLVVAGFGVWLLRAGRPGARRPGPVAVPPPVTPAGPQRPGTAGSTGQSGARVLSLPPVATLSTVALGREWLGTTAALAGRLDPAARQAVVRRRQETLDELERRDPEGFARWLAEGPLPGSDPADWLQEGPAAGTGAA